MIGLVDLFELQDRLDDLLVTGEVTLSEYELAWDGLLDEAGLTARQYEFEIDQRWVVTDCLIHFTN